MKAGKPFLIFGDVRLTACKPISDDDLGDYLAGCVNDPLRHNRVLPIGGPGEAITPREQGERLFALISRPPRFKQVPVALLDAIIAVLGLLGRILPPLAAITPPSPCWCGTKPLAATTQRLRHRPATKPCLTSMAAC